MYINGRPYVLREDERPYKNLQEYAGIDYQRLQRMEVRGVRDHNSPPCRHSARLGLMHVQSGRADQSTIVASVPHAQEHHLVRLDVTEGISKQRCSLAASPVLLRRTGTAAQ